MPTEWRYMPQKTLDDVANLVTPILDIAVMLVPYVTVLALLMGIPRALLQVKVESVRGSFLSPQEQRDLRAVPLSVGIWSLFLMHLLIIGVPQLTRVLGSSATVRAGLEVLMLSFAFLTMLGVINVIVRHGMNRKLWKKFSIIDIGVISQLLGALGVGIFAWATVRWASLWTPAVAWQHFVDSWLFRAGTSSPMLDMPVMAKLHYVLGLLTFSTLLHSKVVTELLIPRPSIWDWSGIMGKDVSQREVGQAAALMYGISPSEKNKHGH